MAERFINLIKQHAEAVLGTRIFVKCGTIANYDPNNYLARVLIPSAPDDIITGWMNIGSTSTGIFVAPNVGDVCQVLYSEGDINGGIVNLFVSSNKPSIAVNSGDVLMEGGGKVSVFSSNISLGDNGSAFKKMVIDTFKTLFNEHTHPNNGQPPTQQMDDSYLTSSTKAN